MCTVERIMAAWNATANVSLSYQKPVLATKRKTSSEESTASSTKVKKMRMEKQTSSERKEAIPSDHYPAKPNTFISGRYFVLKKAGMGAFATVWMCWDTQALRFVALKISRSDPDVWNAALKEKAIFDHLNKMKARSHHIVECLGTLTLKHGDQSFMCLVFEMMGRTLMYEIEANRGLPVVNVHQATKAVLLGLHTLHSCGIVHTDVKPENVLLSLSEQAEEELAYQAIEAFKKMPEAERHIRPLRKHIRALTKRELVIKLADLGSAQFLNSLDYAPVITTAPYRSFEALMQGPWTTKTDVWSVGCMAFELATGRMLMPVGDEQEPLLLNWMISRLGMPPPHLRYNRKHFDRMGGRRDPSPIEKHSIKPDKIVTSSRKRFDVKTADSFVHLVNSMLEFDPNLRPTAGKCLEHPFITGLLAG